MVVGAGYTGTELVAQGQALTRTALRHRAGLSARWILIDVAPRVLPGLNERLSGPALRVLHRRGVDVRLKTSVAEVTAGCVRLSDGVEIPTRTVAWCVGARPQVRRPNSLPSVSRNAANLPHAISTTGCENATAFAASRSHVP